MKSALAQIVSVSKGLEKAALAISCTGMVVMTGCILIQIVARYILSDPPAWTEELARHAMIWSGFMGASVAYARRADPVLLKIQSLKRAWMRRTAEYLEIGAVSLFCSAVIAATPVFLSLQRDLSTEALEIPNTVIVSIIPLSMGLILFHAFARLLTLLLETPEKQGGTE